MGDVGAESSVKWQFMADDAWIQELIAVTGLPYEVK
jgi:hypothetical protein